MPQRDFQDALQRVKAARFTGTCFRVVALESYQKSPTPRLLYDQGPKSQGQRFSPPKDHSGLYVSTELETAGSEYAGSKRKWLRGDVPPSVTFPMEVKLKRILDLTSATVRQCLKITKAEVLSAWLGYELEHGKWPITWSLGSHAFKSGKFDAIRYPSVRNPGGSCLLIFTERLADLESEVTIFREDRTVWEKRP